MTSEEFSPRNEAGVFFVVAVADGVELLAELEVLLDDSGSKSSSNDPLLLFKLLFTALLLLLRFVMISNSSSSEAGEVIAPTGEGRCAGNALGADVLSHGSTFPLVPEGAVAPAPVPF